MKDLLQLILENITTHPQDVQILESQDNDRTVYTISVNPEDMGRVIGKSGKVIKAIRSIAHVIAIRQNTRFRINVAEVDGGEDTGEEDETITEPETAPEIATPPETIPQTSPNQAAEQADQDQEKEEVSELISETINVSEDTEAKKPTAKE